MHVSRMYFDSPKKIGECRGTAKCAEKYPPLVNMCLLLECSIHEFFKVIIVIKCVQIHINLKFNNHNLVCKILNNQCHKVPVRF